jgi:hypothetical protein
VKCVRCGLDSRKRERTGKVCPGCHKEFAFDPNAGDPFSDAAFEAAISAVSAQGSLRWGVEHLYYELCRRKRKRLSPLAAWAFVIALLVGAVALARHASPLFWLAVILLGWVMAMLVRERIRGIPIGARDEVGIALATFDHLWARWLAVHDKPDGLITRKAKEETRRRPAEPDLPDYSFDRAVICDRARTVDLLIANNFHFENNCAVLAIGGYPQGPFETVRAMLQKNPRLQVFALHDATTAGCRLAHRLAHEKDWFPGRAVTDVGLRPAHAAPFRGLLLPHFMTVEVGNGIAADEVAWMSRYALELAAIRPEQVLKRLYRAINRPEAGIGAMAAADGGGGDGVDVYYDDASFSSDAGDGEGAADGFG